MRVCFYDLWSAVSSLMPSLKFLIALPMPRPSWGRRLAPKMMITMNRMIISSGNPSLPIGRSPCASIVPCILLAGLALAALATGRAAAAQFRSSIDAVEVYATVIDARGEPVMGLTAADFTVEEDGQRQAVTTFAAGEFPLALAVAVDRSFSVPRLALNDTVAAARRLIDALQPTDRVMVLAIG